MDATIHWSQGSIDVVSTAHVTNTSSEAIHGLTFNLLPLAIGHASQIETTIGGTPVVPRISGMSLILDFSGPLAPKLSTDVVISYRAYFNTNTGGKKALFMKKNNTIAAYRWIPWLSKKQRFSTPNFGESWVTGVSPRVRVTLRSDTALDYATSGVRTDVSKDGLQQTFVATDVRDFNFAASPNYRIETTNWNGIQIRVLYRTYNPGALLKWTFTGLELHDRQGGRIPVRPPRRGRDSGRRGHGVAGHDVGRRHDRARRASPTSPRTRRCTSGSTRWSATTREQIRSSTRARPTSSPATC